MYQQEESDIGRFTSRHGLSNGERVMMKIKSPFIEILVTLDPEICKDFVVYECDVQVFFQGFIHHDSSISS